MTSPLRVSVIGAGGIAQMMHLPHLAERPDRYTLAVLADRDQATLDIVGRKYAFAKTTTNAIEAATDEGVDVVFVFSSGSHREVTLAALEAGKHVFVEKPIAYHVTEAEEIAAAAEKARGTLMVGYHKRFDPAYVKAREEIQAMDDLRYVSVTVLHPDDGAYRKYHVIWPNPDERHALPADTEWRKDVVAHVTSGAASKEIDHIVPYGAPTAHRVGALFATESMIHDLNAVRGVLGNPSRIVSAHLWQDGFAQTCIAEFPKDVRANMTWVSVPGLEHYEETLRFVGPNKRVTLTFPSPYLRNMPTPLTIERGEGTALSVEHHTASFEEAFRAELEHFRQCLLQGTKPETTVRDGIDDALFIHKIVAAYA